MLSTNQTHVFTSKNDIFLCKTVQISFHKTQKHFNTIMLLNDALISENGSIVLNKTFIHKNKIFYYKYASIFLLLFLHLKIITLYYLFEDLWYTQNKMFRKIMSFSHNHEYSIKRKHFKTIVLNDTLYWKNEMILVVKLALFSKEKFKNGVNYKEFNLE